MCPSLPIELCWGHYTSLREAVKSATDMARSLLDHYHPVCFDNWILRDGDSLLHCELHSRGFALGEGLAYTYSD
jgi:hypothetical protein